MRRESAKLLWDMADAMQAAMDFLADRTLDEYLDSVLLRSAVERQLLILGEAMTQLSRRDRELADTFVERQAVIGMRNILIHRYADIDNDVVWHTCHESLPQFKEAVDRALSEGIDS